MCRHDPELIRRNNTMFYTMEVAGLKRDLPICPLSDSLSIASFVILGDPELCEASARALLELVDADSYDCMFTAEAKSIPLIHEMARQSGAKRYIVARKGLKAYMTDPIWVEDESITTAGKQRLYLGSEEAAFLKGKRVLIVDDVISTGGSLKALEKLLEVAGGTVADRVAILAEGDAIGRADIKYLAPLPLFNADGTVKE